MVIFIAIISENKLLQIKYTISARLGDDWLSFDIKNGKGELQEFLNVIDYFQLTVIFERKPLMNRQQFVLKYLEKFIVAYKKLKFLKGCDPGL